jgi:transcriptional regulator with XRE-family HTH domain
MVSFARRIGDKDKRSQKLLRAKLKEARCEAKLSQAVVGYMLGCTQSYVSKIERTGRVEFVRMQRLAAIYGKPLEWFRTLDNPIRGIEGEGGYLGYSLEEWQELENKRHWLVPKGWGRALARRFGSVDKYVGSPQYQRILNGESIDDVFYKDFPSEDVPSFSPKEKKEDPE